MPTKSGSITGPVQVLINEFSKLPTVGQKTAARLVFHLLNRPRNEAQSLAEAILAVKDKVRFCSVCFSLTEDDPCDICTDDERDRSTLRRGRSEGYLRDRTHLRIQGPLPRTGWTDLAHGWHRHCATSSEGACRANWCGKSGRDHPCDKSECRRRSHSAVYFTPSTAVGAGGESLSLRPTDRRRSGLC